MSHEIRVMSTERSLPSILGKASIFASDIDRVKTVAEEMFGGGNANTDVATQYLVRRVIIDAETPGEFADIPVDQKEDLLLAGAVKAVLDHRRDFDLSFVQGRLN